MSTSRKKDVARGFISGAEVGVIFEINTESTSYNILHPFADISQFSTMSDEEEILFFAGTVFRIDSVRREDDSTWIIKLTLCNEIVEQMEQLMDGVKEQLMYITRWEHLFMKTDDLILFGKYYKMLINKTFSWKDITINMAGINIYYLISVLGDYEKAIEYYKELLSDKNFIDNSKFIVLNIIIGNNYFHLLQYDDALRHYDDAFSLLDKNNKLIGHLYIHIGDVWNAINNFESALLCYEKALKILINHDSDDRDVARIYRKISDIHLKQNNYEDANIYDEQADQIDENYRQRSELNIETSLNYFQNLFHTQLDLSQLQRADTLYSMGLYFLKKSDYFQALEKLLQAKELFENYLPSSDQFVHIFSTLFDSIALVYLLLKDNLNALIMLKKSIDIRISLSPN
jgi:tetratricopeptide (TPR) repeat protein